MNRSEWNVYVLVLAVAVVYVVTPNQVIAAGSPQEAASQAVSSHDGVSRLPATVRPDPAGPIKTNLCEVSAAPERFQGMEVEIRAIVQTGFQTSLLRDDTCSTFIWLSGIEVAGGTTPDSATATLRKDSQFQKMLAYLEMKYKPKNGVFCARCPLYKVTATITGRFEHLRKGELDVTTGTRAGFGYLHAYDSQLIVRKVSNPVAEPIDRSTGEKGASGHPASLLESRGSRWVSERVPQRFPNRICPEAVAPVARILAGISENPKRRSVAAWYASS